MATLKIKATADVSNAKAGIREITAEEAALLTKQTQANLQRRQDAARTAREQVKLAKESGAVSKQELNELRKLERIAAADARQAAREVAAAKKAAAGITRSEGRARAAAERRDLDDFIIRQGEMAREARKLQRGPDVNDRTKVTRKRAVGDSFTPYEDAAFRRVAGPTAAIGSIASLIGLLREAVNELKEIRAGFAAQTVKSGERGLGLSEKLRDAGMKPEDITNVIGKVSGMPGSLSTDELSRIAEEGVSAGITNPKSLLGYIDNEAKKRDVSYDKDSEIALQTRRSNRQEEIKKTLQGREHAQREIAEMRAKFERDVFYDQTSGGSYYNRIAATADTWLAQIGLHDADAMKEAGGPEQFFNKQYNRYANFHSPLWGEGRTITVRLDQSSISNLGGGRPLGGD